MNTVSKKKTLLSCLLAACMGLSAFAGGLLIEANAAELQVQSAALFTASEGVNVLPASQYEKADGSVVGDTGLRFQSPTDEAFTIQLNGVFHRSFGLDWSAPADGWIDGGAEVVFEIAEFGNPDNKFEIHYKGLWQSSAWVEYDYTDSNGDTQTLYRTYGLGYQGTSRMVYSKDIIDGSVNSPDGSDILFSPMLTANESVTDRRFSRTEVRVQNSLTDATAGSTATDGAVVNVVGWSNGGGTVPIASFRDDPESFSPTDAEMEVYAVQQWWDPSGDANYNIGYNLPRINFDNGYTVKIHVSKGLEFMVFSIGEIMDNDYNNYWTNEPFNTWPAMQVDTTGEQAQCADEANAATYWSTVSFYQKWQAVPFIEVEDHDEYVAAGQVITPPEATYATNGNPTATNPVTDIQYRVNGGAWSAVPADGIPACKTGDEVDVRYNVDWNSTTISEIVTLSVRNMTALSAQDVVRVKDAKVTANGQGLSGTATQSEKGLLLEPTIEPSYTFDLVGRFTGNTELRWGTAAEEGWAVNGRVEFTVAEAGNPGNYFKVVWASPYQCEAYVEYVYNGTTLYCAQGRNNSGTYYYVLGTGENHDNAEIADNWDVQYQPWIGQASSSGVLGLEWNGDVLNVMATNEGGSKQILASFENDLNGFEPVTEGTGSKSNLPKISFANGYTVFVKVTGAIDFLLYDVTTAEGTESFDTESFAYEPVWYTRGKAMPVFDDIPVLPGVQVGSDAQLRVPELTYTAGEDAELTVAWIKPDNSESPTQVGGTLSMTDMGDHILRYTVMADGVPYVKELTVHVCDYATFVSGKPATCISEGEGLFTCVHGNALERVVPADENAHSVAYNEQINPTCTTEGVKACWECLYCHKYFAEADCAEELTDLSLPIDPDAHTYWAKWTWDGETPSVEFYCKDCDAEAECTEEIKVVESEEESVDATCQTEGKKVLEASVVFGGYRYIDLHEAVIPVAPHALTAVAEKPSTCMEEGTKAYYICSTCGKIFLDAEGKTETTLEELTIPTGGHQLKEVPAKESTCVEEGNKAYWECSVCGKIFLDAEGKTETSREEVSLPTSGQHNMVQVPAKEPTCTEDGNSTYYKCSECGRCTSDDKGEMEIDESSMKLPATGHKFEGGVCTVCGAEDPGDGASDGLTGGQIAAIVVAAVVVAAGVVVAVVLVIRKKKLGGQK